MLYLFTFLIRIIIIYHAKKFHDNINELSRLLIEKSTTINIFLILIVYFENEFLKTISNTLLKDFYFKQIYKQI